MADSFYRQAMNEEHKKKTGYYNTDRDAQRERDRRMMRDMGPDHKPGSPYSTGDSE